MVGWVGKFFIITVSSYIVWNFKYCRLCDDFSGTKKTKKEAGSASAAAMLARPLDVQTRRLADGYYLLRDWEGYVLIIIDLWEIDKKC